MHRKKRNTIPVTVYSPAPIAKPRMLHAQRPVEVVRPLIWLRELKRMALPLTSAAAMTVAAERMGSRAPKLLIRYTSSSMDTVEAKDTSTNVRSPAEWRLLERSHPITEASSTASAMRSSTEPVFSPRDHSPRRSARGSCMAKIIVFSFQPAAHGRARHSALRQRPKTLFRPHNRPRGARAARFGWR